MKKLIFFLCFIAVFLTSTQVNAQEVFRTGDGVLNASIGLGNALYTGSGYSVTVPGLAVSYEAGVLDNLIDGNASIGIGGFFGISASRSRYRFAGFDYGTNYTNIVIGPRGIFHYQFIENLDTYAGLLLGANIASVSHYGDSPVGYSTSGAGGLAFDTFIGARYYFQPNLAVMAEIGHGIAYLNIGASFRLK